MKKIILILSFTLLLCGCNVNSSNNSNNIRNDIQYISTPKINNCVDKFEKDSNIVIKDIVGNSMNPTIYQGSKVICDSSIKEYKTGYIISSYDNISRNNRTHRIKAEYKDYVITQGDNNIREDIGRVLKENINCVVVGVCY